MERGLSSLDGFSHDELLRYSRHFLLPEIGVEGQRRLRDAGVLVVGAGGLGAPVLQYLAAAGVGRIGIVDFDRVELSNLQRQVIHGTEDVGRKKVESAREAVLAINPGVNVTTGDDQLTSANALERVAAHDAVVDGSDNFPTRYLVNDACVLTGTPLVSAAIFRFEGQASVFATSDGPCYRCLHPEPPPPDLVPSCAEGGVLGVLPGIMGSIEALEAIKLITGAGKGLAGRLLLLDALTMKLREVTLRRDPACPACGENRTVTELIDYEAFCGVGSGTDRNEDEIEPAELRRLLGNGLSPLVVDVRQPHEVAVEPFPGALTIPLDLLPSRLSEVDPHRAVVAVCQRGQRSRRAVELLRAAGFGDVRSLRGGVVEWKAGSGK